MTLNQIKYEPQSNVVIVKQTANAQKEISAILMPDSAQAEFIEGIIVKSNSKFRRYDTVLFNRYSAKEITLDNVQYMILDAKDIKLSIDGTPKRVFELLKSNDRYLREFIDRVVIDSLSDDLRIMEEYTNIRSTETDINFSAGLDKDGSNDEDEIYIDINEKMQVKALHIIHYEEDGYPTAPPSYHAANIDMVAFMKIYEELSELA